MGDRLTVPGEIVESRGDLRYQVRLADGRGVVAVVPLRLAREVFLIRVGDRVEVDLPGPPRMPRVVRLQGHYGVWIGRGVTRGRSTKKWLHDLMGRFAALDGATVGRGPEHPTAPDGSIAGPIRDFLGRHPFLRADPGYVAFLWAYGGACFLRPNGDFLDVSGFHTGMGLMLEDDAPPAYEDGWFAFAVVGERFEGQAVGGSFDFRVESWGVHFRRDDGSPRGPALCGTFEEWLTEVVGRSGRLAGWVV